MIPSEEKAWRLDVIKLRYEALNLTDEQAGLVHQYEQDKQGLFTAPSFSMWEEWDFEWATFREFLSEDQFALYEEQVQEERGGFEKELQARDGQEQHEIDYLEVMLLYYGESKGWRVLVHQEGPEDERTRRIMTALLLEKGGYAG